jgi:RNase H-fold protein (predicted Holliday junction resolvase)
MADADSIVERLERISLGLDALQNLGVLATEVRHSTVDLVVVGAPLQQISGTLQEEVSELIELLKRGGVVRLEVAHG